MAEGLRKNMKKIYYTSFSSKIGTIHVASTKSGVCKISIPAQTKKEFLAWLQKKFDGIELIESSTKNRQIIDELNRYFDRRLVKFHSRLNPVGTEFQRRVWSELKRIKYGKTISYKELAKRIGMQQGFQAVGKANGTNPLPIVVPCHRVVGANSKLVGYAAGLKTKEFLLRLEGALPV
jgi:methylated-DNA-[protein]-cysteine S-methyltransferase